jgi:hypothetical protein
MTTWTSAELDEVGATDELRLAARRQDGTLRNPVTIWVVRHGDDLYVRSVKGVAGAWFRGTQATHQGQIQAAGVAKDVTFADADHGLDDQIDAAYRDKYRSYGGTYVDPIVAKQARDTTIRLVPR